MGYTLKITNSDRAKGDSFGYSMVLHDLHVFRQTQFTPSPTFFTFFSSALWCFVSEKSLQESQDSMIPWPTSLVPRWVAGQVRDERAPLKTCERLLDTLCLKTACVCVRFFLPPHLCCYVNIYIYIHICFFNDHDITFVAWVSLF